MDQEHGGGNFGRFDLNEIATSSPALHPRAAHNGRAHVALESNQDDPTTQRHGRFTSNTRRVRTGADGLVRATSGIGVNTVSGPSSSRSISIGIVNSGVHPE
jgi:hypothetical protein